VSAATKLSRTVRTASIGESPNVDPVARPEEVEADGQLVPLLRAHSRRATYSTDPDHARRLIAKTGSLSVDLETRGLHPHSTADAAIGAVIVRTGGKNFIFREIPEWWPEVYSDPDTRKIGHNLKFDSMWMIEFCPGDQGLPVARNLQDTMLKSQLVHRYKTPIGAKKAGNPEAWEPNDLKSVLVERLGVSIGKEIDHDVTDWTGDWSDDMIEYMLQDIEYLDDLNANLDREILKSGQERAAWIEMNSVFATAWMTLNGLTPNIDAWVESIESWKADQNHLLWHLQRKWPGVDNYNSPAQLVRTSGPLFGGEPLPNTRKSTLKQLSSAFPAVAMLLDQRKLATYLKNWGGRYLRDYVCALCGKFHPGWHQIGTETSRYSCSRPNLQQIPRVPEFRRLFVASPGCSLASLDYSAIEVLTAAVFAEEYKLMEACRSGDPHLATARMISGDDSITKSDPRRQNAKIANFGLLFGGGAEGLVKQALDLFDVTMSLQEAQAVMGKYYAIYPGLKKTKNWAYRAMEVPDKAVVQTNAVGFRRYLEGYKRKPTSWLNTWIQSTAQYGIKTAMHYLQEARLLPFVCGQIHDEILFEFPDNRAEAYAERARACMVRGMQDVLGPLAPITVDVNIGKVWL
jgi:DNA polymerase-1